MFQSLALHVGNLCELAQLLLLSPVRFVGNTRAGRKREGAGAELARCKKAYNNGTVCEMDEQRLPNILGSFALKL